jgi:N-methylhydantoinase A
VAVFEARFEEDYTKLFGRPVAGMDIEITVWSVNATTPPEEVEPIDVASAVAAAAVMSKRPVFDPNKAAYLDTQIVDRETMGVGQYAQGPAAITEAETTIIVPTSRMAICQSDGCIDVIVKGDV